MLRFGSGPVESSETKFIKKQMWLNHYNFTQMFNQFRDSYVRDGAEFVCFLPMTALYV